MGENNPSPLNELRSSLASFQQLRHSSITSIVLMLIGVAIIVGSFIYSIKKLGPLERQIAEKQITVGKLNQTLEELDKEKRGVEEQLMISMKQLSLVVREG